MQNAHTAEIQDDDVCLAGSVYKVRCRFSVVMCHTGDVFSNSIYTVFPNDLKLLVFGGRGRLLTKMNSDHMKTAVRRCAGKAVRSLQHADARYRGMVLGIDLSWFASHIAFQSSRVPHFDSFVIGTRYEESVVWSHNYPVDRSRMGTEMGEEGDIWSSGRVSWRVA